MLRQVSVVRISDDTKMFSLFNETYRSLRSPGTSSNGVEAVVPQELARLQEHARFLVPAFMFAAYRKMVTYRCFLTQFSFLQFRGAENCLSMSVGTRKNSTRNPLFVVASGTPSILIRLRPHNISRIRKTLRRLGKQT